MNVANKTTTIHIISHNHWDREWIFTSKYTNRWLVPFFDNLFKMLSEKPNYRFVLDGQTMMIEDYLGQLSEEEAASKEAEIRGYVKEGKLLLGPCYMQPDWTLVSGEALVRNLMIGHRMAEGFGEVMKVGWLLDNFGQISQAPQIHRGFGISGVFLWRGVGMEPDEMRSEFWWESPDGSTVLAIYLLDTYRNAMALAETKGIAAERIIAEARKLIPFASTPNVLLMNGYEQDPGPDDVLPIIEQVNRESKSMRVIQSTPPEYLDAVREFNPELPILKGSLYSGRYAPVLTGVFSSRMHLKQQNDECQRVVERWAEPFSTLAWALGAEYPRKALNESWKILLKNHPHDDICGCSIDPVHRDMEERFNQSRKIADEVTAKSLMAIASEIDTSKMSKDGIALIVFNPSAWKRRSVVRITAVLPPTIKSFSLKDPEGKAIPYQLRKRRGDEVEILFPIEDLPPLGYKTYYLVPGLEMVRAEAEVTASERHRRMENEYLIVKINEDGSLQITDKRIGHQYNKLGYFEDGGDAGDTYDYSYPRKDKIITSLGREARVSLVESGSWVARFKIELCLDLPVSLNESRTKRALEAREYPIVTYVTLTSGSPRLDFKTQILNVVKDHRLRVLFPTSLNTDHSYAGGTFDIIKFPIKADAYDKKIPERLAGLVIAGRQTVPITTHPYRDFVDLTDGEKGFAVISAGLTEYEVLEEKKTIALTLIRSVGWLARDDLLTREGDIGPKIFTPGAQCLGEHTFHYALLPHQGDWFEGRVPEYAEDHNLGPIIVQTAAHPGMLPPIISFISLASEPPNAFLLTALKRSEEGDDLIIRFYNALDRETRGKISFNLPVKEAWLTDLNEGTKGRLPPHEGAIPVEARGKEIVTLRVKLSRQAIICNLTAKSARLIKNPSPAEEGILQVEPPPAITEEEIKKEEERTSSLSAELEQVEKKASLLQREAGSAPGDLHLLARLQRAKSESATLRRSLLEARLSVLLNRKEYLNIKEPKGRRGRIEEIEREIGKIGDEMCKVRIEKRTAEFLQNFYENLIREQEVA